MTTPHELTPAIRGALAYLDAVTTAEQKRMAETTDQELGIKGMNQNLFRENLASVVSRTFKLALLRGFESDLAKELEAYRLYNKSHSADALAAAWCLSRRGGQAQAALMADYDYQIGGIIRHTDIAELQKDAKNARDSDNSTWGRLRGFYRDGDFVLYYRYGGGDGYVVLRGRRLVVNCEALYWQMSHTGVAKIIAEIKAYDEAGGSEAVLAGKLVWPPEGWVNPVTDEQAAAFVKERFGKYAGRG